MHLPCRAGVGVTCGKQHLCYSVGPQDALFSPRVPYKGVLTIQTCAPQAQGVLQTRTSGIRACSVSRYSRLRVEPEAQLPERRSLSREKGQPRAEEGSQSCVGSCLPTHPIIWPALPSWLQAPYNLMTCGWLTCFRRLNSECRSRNSLWEAFSETQHTEDCVCHSPWDPLVTMSSRERTAIPLTELHGHPQHPAA